MPLPPRSCPGGSWRNLRWGWILKMMGNWSAGPSAGSRTGTEIGRTPKKGSPKCSVRCLESSILPKATKACPDFLEDVTRVTVQRPPNMPTVGLTYQVSELYSGHGSLQGGPQTPEKMRCQGIPRERGAGRGGALKSPFHTAWLPAQAAQPPKFPLLCRFPNPCPVCDSFSASLWCGLLPLP